jgi:hypothetical protein
MQNEPRGERKWDLLVEKVEFLTGGSFVCEVSGARADAVVLDVPNWNTRSVSTNHYFFNR